MFTNLEDLMSIYKTPKDQSSILFNVPMSELSQVKKVLQEHFKDKKETYNIRWRGPRYTGTKQRTLKKDAVAFSVYGVQRRENYKPFYSIEPKFVPLEYVTVNGYNYKLVI